MSEECSICLESMENNKYTLECNHTFHTNCILKWFRNGNSICPLCKQTKIHQDINFTYYQKLSTIKEIKKWCKKNSSPQLKKYISKINKITENEKQYEIDFKNFKKENKNILSEYKKLCRKRWFFKRKRRIVEDGLLGYVTLKPIYIVQN